MSYAERLHQKLTAALAPVCLEISDDSDQHAGHAGHRPGGETHFSILVVSARFEGLSRVARHRLVYDIVRLELDERVHALALKTRTIAEHDAA
jgi:BolA family transcriptional regulator, general stress-responsive regulator